MKNVLILFCLLVTITFYPLDSFAQQEVKMDYVCRDGEGEERWQADTEISKKEGDVFVMVEKGRGKHSGFESEEVSWVSEMKFESSEDTVKPIKLEKRVFDDKGNKNSCNP